MCVGLDAPQTRLSSRCSPPAAQYCDMSSSRSPCSSSPVPNAASPDADADADGMSPSIAAASASPLPHAYTYMSPFSTHDNNPNLAAFSSTHFSPFPTRQWGLLGNSKFQPPHPCSLPCANFALRVRVLSCLTVHARVSTFAIASPAPLVAMAVAPTVHRTQLSLHIHNQSK